MEGRASEPSSSRCRASRIPRAGRPVSATRLGAGRRSRGDEPTLAEIATAQPFAPLPIRARQKLPTVHRPPAAPASRVITGHWRLLAAGFAADDCAAIRGIDRDVVLDHALCAIDSGWPVDVALLLSPELRVRLDALIGHQRPERIRPLLTRLPNGTRYEEVQLYLKCRFPGGLRGLISCRFRAAAPGTRAVQAALA